VMIKRIWLLLLPALLLGVLFVLSLENRETDPTGYKTLVKILETNDIANWQKAWEKWVLDLRR